MSIKLLMIEENLSLMHREYHKFYAVHVYLQSICISLMGTHLALIKQSCGNLAFLWSLVITALLLRMFPKRINFYFSWSLKNNGINYDWLNLSLTSYKLKCKNLLYLCNEWKVYSNGTTSTPKSIPCLVLVKVRLVPVIQPFPCFQWSPTKVNHKSWTMFCSLLLLLLSHCYFSMKYISY